MSAASRLWRRAPLWRLTLASAASFAILSVLYPTPSILALIRRATPTDPGAAPVEQLIGSYPPFEAVFSGTLPFAGRILPLPSGEWHELVSGRSEHDTELDFMVLGRVEHGALTGAIVASASVFPADGPIKPHLPFGCFDTRSTVAVPPADSGPHDCWFARTTSLSHLARRADERLTKLGITVGPSLVATTWSRVEGGDFEEVTIAVPATSHATVRTRSAWMQKWRGLLRRGYDGTLTASDVPPRAARDPV